MRARGWRPSSRVPRAPPSDPRSRSTQRRFASRRVTGPARLTLRARIYLTFSHFHISRRAQGPRAPGIKAQRALSADGQRVVRGRTRLAQNGRCALGADLPPPPPPPPSPSLSCQAILPCWSPAPLLPVVPTRGVAIDRENEHDALGVAWLGGVCSARRRENTWLNRLWAGWP